MKKKIKDLTVEEVNAICHKQDDCDTCPLANRFGTCIIMPPCFVDELEEEVEVDE